MRFLVPTPRYRYNEPYPEHGTTGSHARLMPTAHSYAHADGSRTWASK